MLNECFLTHYTNEVDKQQCTSNKDLSSQLESSLCRRTRQTVGGVTPSAPPSTPYCSSSCSCSIRLSAPTFTLYYINSIFLHVSSFSLPDPKPSNPTSHLHAPIPHPPYIVIGNKGTSLHSKLEALSAALPSSLQSLLLSDNCRTFVYSAS